MHVYIIISMKLLSLCHLFRYKQSLSHMWEDLYNHWNNKSSIVSLDILDTLWDIKIKRRGEILGKGWMEFIDAVGLRKGDYLVAFKEKDTENNVLRVCIYSEYDHKHDKNSDMVLSINLNIPLPKKMGWFHNYSYLHFISRDRIITAEQVIFQDCL